MLPMRIGFLMLLVRTRLLILPTGTGLLMLPMRIGFLILPVRVCRKPTNPSNPTQPNSTRRVGSVFKASWVGLGWVTKFFFIASRVGFGS